MVPDGGIPTHAAAVQAEGPPPPSRQAARATLRAAVNAHLAESHPDARRAHRRKAARIAVAQLLAQLAQGPVVLDA
jgi:hypothetical protein